LRAQAEQWAAEGFRQVKVKIGREPDRDPGRVGLVRGLMGPQAQLFVDANGAYHAKQALVQAERLAPLGVSWFEEPVSSDDLEGLHLLRNRAPAQLEIAAGEYGYDLPYFQRMLQAQAVDVLQADATRCGGITGFLQVAALTQSYGLPLSAHTAPSAHLPACCAVSNLRNLEYFHDHARIEHLLFEGARKPVQGELQPDLARPGLGLEFKTQDAQRYAL
jgi:L-alanine-DL-glutamate epimerase-like enolase superfamily enzyme